MALDASHYIKKSTIQPTEFHIISWLGEESLVQTFDEDLKCNVDEIRTLLDELDNRKEGEQA